MPLPRRVGLGKQFMKRAALPQVLLVGYEEFTGAQIQRHSVSRVGLDFESMSASLGSRLYNPKCSIERLIVIAGHFGNDERFAV